MTWSRQEPNLELIPERLSRGQAREAIPELQAALRVDPTDWNLHYLMGFACRCIEDFEGAVASYRKAQGLVDPQDRSGLGAVLLNLGVALQLREDFDEAVQCFRDAISLNPDEEPNARNSLALTYHKMASGSNRAGELLKRAVEEYSQGVTALCRAIYLSLKNLRSNPIVKYRDTEGTFWVEKASEAYLWGAARDGIQRVAWPTGEIAAREERTEEHEGLYFVEWLSEKGEKSRMLLPNYLNTFRETLKSDVLYCNFLNSMGTVLYDLNEFETARERFIESIEFTPTGVDFPAPERNLARLGRR